MRYRKRPLVIEAVQWDGNPDTVLPLMQDKNARRGSLYLDSDNRIQIATLEGFLWCPIGHWIVKGIKGELYPVADDVFKATYEPEEDSPVGDQLDVRN